MLAQERELAEKRMLDDRRRLTDDIARELFARVEPIRVAAVNRGATALAAPDDAVALAVRVDANRSYRLASWQIAPWRVSCGRDLRKDSMSCDVVINCEAAR